MAFFRKAASCPKCGKGVSQGANFCPYCGVPLSTGRRVCGFCGAEAPADAVYCSRCGRPMEETERPAISGNRWGKGGDDFAVRVDVTDVPGFFRRELIIEPGTRALFIVDGRVPEEGVLGPGRYAFDNLAQRIAGLGKAREVTAILVDGGDVELDFTIPDLFTSDPIRITMDCRLVVRVGNPVLFLTNLMKGRRNFPRSELRRYLFEEIQNATQEAVGEWSVRELHANLAFKEELATHIGAHLKRTFERAGLDFDRVRALNFRHERWDEMRGVKEEYFLQLSREEAELEGRRRLLDVLSQKELQELAYYEGRVQLHDRMRRAVLEDKLSELRTEEELERYLHELDRQKLLREEEIEELKRQFAWRREGWEALKRHYLSLLDAMFEMELEKLRRKREREEDLADLEIARKGFEILSEHKARKMQLELERMEKMSRLSVEALIAVSGPEQARLLAELKRTEILRGMSEEQILALAAEKSPEVARAFQEKFRALSAEEQGRFYERLLEARRASDEKTTELLREALAGIVEALGQGREKGPAVVVTGQGTPTVISGSGVPTGGEVQICRRCHAKSPVGTKYCPNCGEAFF